MEELRQLPHDLSEQEGVRDVLSWFVHYCDVLTSLPRPENEEDVTKFDTDEDGGDPVPTSAASSSPSSGVTGVATGGGAAPLLLPLEPDAADAADADALILSGVSAHLADVLLFQAVRTLSYLS